VEINKTTNYDASPRFRACRDCGVGYIPGDRMTEFYHWRSHDRAVNGVPTKLVNGFHAITHRSLMPSQNRTQTISHIANWDAGYDSVCFSAMKTKSDEYDTIAMICVDGQRACALIVTRNKECKYTAKLDSFKSVGMGSWLPPKRNLMELHNRRAIDMIWVAKNRRRQGLAQRLAKELATYCAIGLQEFAHTLPFRGGAIHRWKALNLSTIYLI
jgi:ribosomal protein S18 acetylase RimI-like enzyme